MELVETLNRTLKLAMDEGKVGSYEEAKSLFATFRLRISVCPGFTHAPAAEAAVLTLLNAAPKTFLGGVEVEGALEERCTLAWFAGLTLADVAKQFGVTTAQYSSNIDVPTLLVGKGSPARGNFSIGLSLEVDGFTLSPDWSGEYCTGAPVEIGVAAAGAALNEAFQYVYKRFPLAGQREIRLKLPLCAAKSTVRNCWVVGLGHLGQAFLWTSALAGRAHPVNAARLTDYDTVSWSSLSTCLVVQPKDVGRKKVDAVADRLAALGVAIQRDDRCLSFDEGTEQSEQDLVVVAVDNLALRRSLDRLNAKHILEAGIGDGADAFTRIQLHAFPGPRRARDIWAGDDARVARHADLSAPAYQVMLKDSGDACGTALVAGRSVATPFVGAFAGALLSWLAVHPSESEYAWSFDINSL